ncbi:MAG: tetratricopeptide repeat protein [Lachnospiraceae bacterium]|nr:tetratricopeptide repeat protein [Lachnospiraceae bacterium]
MNCYRCGAALSEKDFCTACGADVSKYKKIIYTSNRLYNEGLEKAGVRDLSGAIMSLRESLKFDRSNVEARNLLGLCYFETGDVVGALTEWVISKNFRSKKNLADDYIYAVQSNPARLESINQSIKKYNKALMYCYQDSKDLAIIQLKKVLSQNPHLIQGHLLLALLFLDSEQYARAKKSCASVLAIDVGNTMALSYLKYANKMLGIEEDDGVHTGGAPASKKKKSESVRAAEGSVTYQSGNDIIIQPADVHEPRGASSLLNILIGLIIGVAVTYFLVLPARIQVTRNEMSDELKAISDNSDAKSARISELEQSVEALEQEKTQLQTAIDDYTGSGGDALKVDALLVSVKGYLDNPDDPTQIAETLYSIDRDYIETLASDSYRSLYQKMMALAAPSVSAKLYESGKASVNQSDYTTAVTTLEEAWFFARTLEQPDPEVLYELAVAYQMAGENDKAKDTYQSVIATFPDSSTAGKASERLDEMGDGTGAAPEANTGGESTQAAQTPADGGGADAAGEANVDEAGAQEGGGDAAQETSDGGALETTDVVQ